MEILFWFSSFIFSFFFLFFFLDESIYLFHLDVASLDGFILYVDYYYYYYFWRKSCWFFLISNFNGNLSTG